MSELILPYDRAIVPQETSWWCGPASTQVVLNSRGILKSERDLMLELERLEGNNGWDDQDGTDSIGQVATVLNKYLGGGYVVRARPNDPPTRAQIDELWNDIVASVNGGYGVVANIAVPRGNFPRGTRGSRSPAYSGNFVWHYFSVMGYYEGPDGRHVWIADSGFGPYGYWMSLEQLASAIASKGYTAKPVGGASPAIAAEDVDAQAVINFIQSFTWPLITDVKDVREQFCGGGCRDAGQYVGWLQLGTKTLVDGLADFRNRIGNI